MLSEPLPDTPSEPRTEPHQSRVPNASERGTQLAVAHKWGGSLHNLYCLGGVPTASERGTKSVVATSRPGGYINPTTRGVPRASQRGTKSAMADKWAWWLHGRCHMGVPVFQSMKRNQR